MSDSGKNTLTSEGERQIEELDDVSSKIIDEGERQTEDVGNTNNKVADEGDKQPQEVDNADNSMNDLSFSMSGVQTPSFLNSSVEVTEEDLKTTSSKDSPKQNSDGLAQMIMAMMAKIDENNKEMKGKFDIHAKKLDDNASQTNAKIDQNALQLRHEIRESNIQVRNKIEKDISQFKSEMQQINKQNNERADQASAEMHQIMENVLQDQRVLRQEVDDKIRVIKTDIQNDIEVEIQPIKAGLSQLQSVVDINKAQCKGNADRIGKYVTDMLEEQPQREYVEIKEKLTYLENKVSKGNIVSGSVNDTTIQLQKDIEEISGKMTNIDIVINNKVDDMRVQLQSEIQSGLRNNRYKLVEELKLTSNRMPDPHIQTTSSTENSSVQAMISMGMAKSLEMPIYPNKGSRSIAPQYIDQMEEYFRLVGMPTQLCLNCLSQSLKGNVLSWYREIKPNINSWSEFKTKFLAEFNGSVRRMAYQVELENCRQKVGQSVETFIWDTKELVNLAYANITEEEAVNLILRKMEPDYLDLMRSHITTITQLINCAKELENVLNLRWQSGAGPMYAERRNRGQAQSTPYRDERERGNSYRGNSNNRNVSTISYTRRGRGANGRRSSNRQANTRPTDSSNPTVSAISLNGTGGTVTDGQTAAPSTTTQ